MLCSISMKHPVHLHLCFHHKVVTFFVSPFYLYHKFDGLFAKDNFSFILNRKQTSK